ncbi:hypothetical protein Tco_1151362 [Tanacetum coccineum]
MRTTMVPVQVKTLEIQAGVQVSRPGELRRHLQLWKTLFVLYLYLIGTLVMSTSTHHIIIPSDSNVEDVISSTNTPDYTPASPDYPFDESIFAELDNSLWIIPRLLRSEPVPEEPNESDAY